METTTKKLSKDVLKLALQILNGHRASWETYLEECEEYAAKGFRHHYCFHGVNMWVDYDCACGMCEEYGSSFHYSDYAAFALAEAKQAHAEMRKRLDMLIGLHAAGAPLDIAKLGAWACEPIEKYKPKG